MQSNYIPPPVFTEIVPENKQLEQTSLSEETGTEKLPQPSLSRNNLVSEWPVCALQASLMFQFLPQ